MLYKMTTVQNGVPADHNACVKLMTRLPDSFNSTGISKFIHELPQSNLLIAKEGNKLHGFITWVLRGQKLAEITWLAVAPDSQGKGLGRQLVEHAEQAARNRGAHHMEVKTLAEGPDSPSYEHTRRFYETRGFKLVKVIDSYPGWEPGNPCAVYKKRLS